MGALRGTDVSMFMTEFRAVITAILPPTKGPSSACLPVPRVLTNLPIFTVKTFHA